MCIVDRKQKSNIERGLINVDHKNGVNLNEEKDKDE